MVRQIAVLLVAVLLGGCSIQDQKQPTLPTAGPVDPTGEWLSPQDNLVTNEYVNVEIRLHQGQQGPGNEIKEVYVTLMWEGLETPHAPYHPPWSGDTVRVLIPMSAHRFAPKNKPIEIGYVLVTGNGKRITSPNTRTIIWSP